MRERRAAVEVHIFHSRQSVRMAGTAIGLRSRQGGLRMAWNLLSSIDHWAGITFVFRSALKPRERRMRKLHYLLQESRWSLCFWSEKSVKHGAGGGNRGLGKTWVVRGGYSRPALKVDVYGGPRSTWAAPTAATTLGMR